VTHTSKSLDQNLWPSGHICTSPKHNQNFNFFNLPVMMTFSSFSWPLSFDRENIASDLVYKQYVKMLFEDFSLVKAFLFTHTSFFSLRLSTSEIKNSIRRRIRIFLVNAYVQCSRHLQITFVAYTFPTYITYI
jgi:hypothetical protein